MSKDATFTRSARWLAAAAVLAATTVGRADPAGNPLGTDAAAPSVGAGNTASTPSASTPSASTPSASTPSAAGNGAAISPGAAAENAPPFKYPSQKLEQMRDDYLQAQGLREGENDDGSWVAYAWQQVDSPPGPRWGIARISAFTLAEEKARRALVTYLGANVASHTASTLFSDSGATLNSPTPPPADAGGDAGRLERIRTKVETVAEAELDSALKKLGKSDAEIQAMTPPQRRTALKTELAREVCTSGFAGISGFRVIQSLEGRVGDHYGVAVIVRYSEHSKQVADLIHQGGGTMVGAPPGHPLAYYLPKDPTEQLMNYGIRVFSDENGQPIVVAFSQAAISAPAGASLEWEEAQTSAADDLAENEARGMLADFASGSTNAQVNSKRGIEVEKGVETQNGVDQIFEDPARVTQAITTVIHTDSVAYQQVGSVYKHLHLKHPETGQMFSEVIFVWTPGGADRARQMRNGGPTAPKTSTDNKSSGHTGSNFPVKDW